MGSGKAMEPSSGTTVRFLKDNGKMELKMALVSGDLQGAIFIKEIGYSIDSMEKGPISIVSAPIEDNFPTF